MLQHLHIQHYALIGNADIDFDGGYSVLTGETGAGKSIILGALALVMGARADTKSITEGEDKCIIEALFNDSEQGELLIRRELGSNGRSRSFVNDEVVTQQELKALATRLIDIHSQHENLLIENYDFQLGIVDAIARNDAEREAYSRCYEAYMQCKQELQDLKDLAARTNKDQEYIAFQYHQLDEAHLTDGEVEELEEEQYRLSHAEDIKQNLQTILFKLDDDEHGAAGLIHSCRLDDTSAELENRLRSVDVELKDIISDLTRLYDQTEFNPQRLQEVEERLDILNTLLRKHNVPTIAELIQVRDELGTQMERIANFDSDIARLTAELEKRTIALRKAAQTLTTSRQSVRKNISEELIANLGKLGILHANVDIAIEPLDDFTPTGGDNVQFLFAANLNQSLRRICEVASGGEIARIMLCIKALIASTNGLPTIIFDEIDTGVSGEIATQMGRIMHQMAQSRQIIAITHNPQIAVQADKQYLVYKQDEATRTETHIRLLDEQERQHYIDTVYASISRAIASKDAE